MHSSSSSSSSSSTTASNTKLISKKRKDKRGNNMMLFLGYCFLGLVGMLMLVAATYFGRNLLYSMFVSSPDAVDKDKPIAPTVVSETAKTEVSTNEPYTLLTTIKDGIATTPEESKEQGDVAIAMVVERHDIVADETLPEASVTVMTPEEKS